MIKIIISLFISTFILVSISITTIWADEIDTTKLAQLLCQILNSDDIPAALGKFGKLDKNFYDSGERSYHLETKMIEMWYRHDYDAESVITPGDHESHRTGKYAFNLSITTKNCEKPLFKSKSDAWKWIEHLGIVKTEPTVLWVGSGGVFPGEREDEFDNHRWSCAVHKEDITKKSSDFYCGIQFFWWFPEDAQYNKKLCKIK